MVDLRKRRFGDFVAILLHNAIQARDPFQLKFTNVSSLLNGQCKCVGVVTIKMQPNVYKCL